MQSQPPSAPDPQLHRLIQAERVRMLFGAALPVDLVSAVFSVAMAWLISRHVGDAKALTWTAACLTATALRLACRHAYLHARDRAAPHWLGVTVFMSAVMGAAWGLGGAWAMPRQDLNVTAVIVGTLSGAASVCSFSLQAHTRPNWVYSALLLVPPALALLARQDAYGVFGGMGLLALMGIMMLEGSRSARRITELLWLRFTTDRIAQERAQALQLAQRHSAVKDQFLATMSHEMRTPLHGILGLARLVHQQLTAQADAMAQARERVALIERSGEHLLELINDVLDFSRIEAGKLHIESAPFDLSALVADVLALQGVTAAGKGLELRLDLRLARPCPVQGDAARLRQVLHNLVGNAIKFTQDGHVRVSALRPLDDAAEVVFTVQDTGIGIAPAQQARVFEAFHQVDGRFQRSHDGTGLGLTISREVARAMGGDIQCRSTPGEGSVFTVSVPLPSIAAADLSARAGVGAAAAANSAGPGSGAEPPREAPARLSGHVLLAEDNAVNALVAQATLSQLGLRVTHVEDGQQALQVLSQPEHGIDLVLMDCQMPVLDGIEATRRLRALERRRGHTPVPVIALTANTADGDRERCRQAGMNGHLAKPFSPAELAAALHAELPASCEPAAAH